ncbi:MAG TPA: hypothetical protein VGG49_06425 [Steroidobacteraceae bacterium]|jgi:hypothetical protein
MDLRDVEVQLSAQRLQELMLWHGKDEGNLPPAATLVNLSRDTIAALGQLQLARTQLARLRATLSQVFWACDSSQIRKTLLEVLGAPPDDGSLPPAPPMAHWEASPNGLPQPTAAPESRRERAAPQHAAS